MEKKVAHLEMLQGVINRMASNSFQLKGWSVLLVSALFALASKDSMWALVYVAYLPALAFWLLDGYFLWQERLFRLLYDKTRTLPDDHVDFSMTTDPKAPDAPTWLRTSFSRTQILFHGVVIAAIVASTMLLNFG